jgi:hypothetical protein
MVSSFGKLSAHQFKDNAHQCLLHNTFVGNVSLQSHARFHKNDARSCCVALNGLKVISSAKQPEFARAPFPAEGGTPPARR